VEDNNLEGNHPARHVELPAGFQFSLAQLLLFSTFWCVVVACLWNMGLNGMPVILGVMGCVLPVIGVWCRRTRITCFGIMCLVVAPAAYHIINWHADLDGHLWVRIRFTIIDADSRLPVPNATVSIRDTFRTGTETPSHVIDPKESVYEGITDINGQVALTCFVPCNTRITHFADSPTRVLFPSWLWIDVRASDYSVKFAMLRDIIGAQADATIAGQTRKLACRPV